MVYLLIYVDDIILTTSHDTLRANLIHQLAVEFDMEDLGPLSHFWGINVARQQNTMFLSLQSYALDISDRAGMSSCKSVATPVDTKSKLSASLSNLLEDPTIYRSLAGALQYLTFTRPDISYAVQQVCMHMHSTRIDHWNSLKCIIRYIRALPRLVLGTFSELSLRAYTDADWAGFLDTRRSTSGYCAVVSHSSAEAEYRGVTNVVAELCSIRNLLLELHRPLRKASVVYCDNISAIYLSGNLVQHQRAKHIELDIHFVRDLVQRGDLRILHIPSRYQIADIFTKGLPRALFDDFRSSLSIRSPLASTAGAWRLYKEGRSIELMSASLHASRVVSEVLRSIHVALLCVQHHAEDRPTMLSVVLMLVSNGSLPAPKQPAFFSEESSYEHDSIQSVDECTITIMYAR
ncbi:putative RNA-directed DNA polymerase [Helianthus debilis subsp. tardiflorus]